MRGGGLFLTLTLMVLASALLAGHVAYERQQFFDPAVYLTSYPCALDPSYEPRPLDPEFEWLLASPLRASGERPLYKADLDGQTTVRFGFVPAFSPHVVVRVDDIYGQRPRLMATRDVHQVMKKSGPNFVNRDLLEAEVKGIRTLVREVEAKNIQPDSCITYGLDGAFYVIEIKGPQGYRLINRWIYLEPEVYDLMKSLYQLTGWPQGRQGPDLGDIGQHTPDWD